MEPRTNPLRAWCFLTNKTIKWHNKLWKAITILSELLNIYKRRTLPFYRSFNSTVRIWCPASRNRCHRFNILNMTTIPSEFQSKTRHAVWNENYYFAVVVNYFDITIRCCRLATAPNTQPLPQNLSPFSIGRPKQSLMYSTHARNDGIYDLRKFSNKYESFHTLSKFYEMDMVSEASCTV